MPESQLAKLARRRAEREAEAEANGEVAVHNDEIEDEVVADILNGGHDATLRQINQACVDRMRTLQRVRAAEVAGTWSPGMRVRAREDSSLRHTDGGEVLGEIVAEPGRRRQTKVLVELERPVGKWVAGTKILYPISEVEPVE